MFNVVYHHRVCQYFTKVRKKNLETFPAKNCIGIMKYLQKTNYSWNNDTSSLNFYQTNPVNTRDTWKESYKQRKIYSKRFKKVKINQINYAKNDYSYPPSTISSRHNKIRSKFSSASFLSTVPLKQRLVSTRGAKPKLGMTTTLFRLFMIPMPMPKLFIYMKIL